jgi:hypothetical protein
MQRRLSKLAGFSVEVGNILRANNAKHIEFFDQTLVDGFLSFTKPYIHLFFALGIDSGLAEALLALNSEPGVLQIDRDDRKRIIQLREEIKLLYSLVAQTGGPHLDLQSDTLEVCI